MQAHAVPIVEPKFASVELFSGCGGLALGLARAGFNHRFLVEFNGCAVATVEHNRAAGLKFVEHWPIQKDDVRDVDWRPFAGVDLVAGGRLVSRSVLAARLKAMAIAGICGRKLSEQSERLVQQPSSLRMCAA
jgi:DNA (cytosine-5)-methyltransferase 1